MGCKRAYKQGMEDTLAKCIEEIENLGCNDQCGCSITIPNAVITLRALQEKP